jgi:hypothetical protein
MFNYLHHLFALPPEDQHILDRAIQRNIDLIRAIRAGG